MSLGTREISTGTGITCGQFCLNPRLHILYPEHSTRTLLNTELGMAQKQIQKDIAFILLIPGVASFILCIEETGLSVLSISLVIIILV